MARIEIIGRSAPPAWTDSLLIAGTQEPSRIAAALEQQAVPTTSSRRSLRAARRQTGGASGAASVRRGLGRIGMTERHRPAWIAAEMVEGGPIRRSAGV